MKRGNLLVIILLLSSIFVATVVNSDDNISSDLSDNSKNVSIRDPTNYDLLELKSRGALS